MDDIQSLSSKKTYLEQLHRQKQNLLDQQRKLIEKIKKDHYQAYCWMKEHKIDLEHLKSFLVKLALAFTVTTIAFAHTGIYAKTSRDIWVDPVVPITVEELKGKDEDEKAALVWERYSGVIKQASFIYQVDQKLIFATIMVESMGNSFAYRFEPRINDASYGLAQILYGTARLIGFEGKAEELYIPEVSIDLLARYHRRNLDTYGQDLTNKQLAIAYNSGSPYGYPTYGYTEKVDKWLVKASELGIGL